MTLKNRAILGHDVRLVLARNPEGMTRAEISKAVPNACAVLSRLRFIKFARVMPWNHRENKRREDLWFASEPGKP